MYTILLNCKIYQILTSSFLELDSCVVMEKSCEKTPFVFCFTDKLTAYRFEVTTQCSVNNNLFFFFFCLN